MSLTVADILRRLEAFAPAALAESWDNIGLLVGDDAQPVKSVLTALDASAEVLEQAAACEASLLVTHHPLIFSGIKRLMEDGGISALVRRLIRENRSLISLHTNLDSAPGGLNDAVAGMLELSDVRVLVPAEARQLMKLVVYAPLTHVEQLREAICAAGAGHIGNYSDCTFAAEGTGTFRPLAGTDPFIGSVGELESMREQRLETVVPKQALGNVLRAMRDAHPYEEIAYDLFTLENPWPGAGLGRIGTLPEAISAGELVEKVKNVLNTRRVSLAGDPAKEVRTVALCTGGGAEYYDRAASMGADAYLTAEVKHHQALQAARGGAILIDAGHFPTEHPASKLLADIISNSFPELRVTRAEERDPLDL